jgi:hypothetical protein
MSLSGRNVSRGAPAIDERGKDPGEKHPRQDEQTDRDRERDSNSETGKSGHDGRRPLAIRGGRIPEMPDEEEARRTSAKAVAAALLLAGVVVIGVVIFLAVVLQRAC